MNTFRPSINVNRHVLVLGVESLRAQALQTYERLYEIIHYETIARRNERFWAKYEYKKL